MVFILSLFSEFYKYLPQESLGYIYLDGQANNKLIGDFIYDFSKSNFLKNFLLKKTEHIFISVDFSSDNTPLLNIILLGGFNKNQLNFALSSESGWERVNRKLGWWQNPDLNISVASPLDKLISINTTVTEDFLELFSQPANINIEKSELLCSQDMSLLISDFSKFISLGSSTSSYKMPINSISFHANNIDNIYDFFGNIEFNSNRAAKVSRPAVLTMINMELYKMGITKSFLNKDLKISTNKSSLDIKGIFISVDKILPLVYGLLNINGETN